MRHYNPTSTSCLSHRVRRRTCPYYHQYTDSYNRTGFANADSSKRYVQILKYIADHDGCKRNVINIAVFKMNPDYVFSKGSPARGYASIIFSQLLYLDLIDYDSEYRYHITDKGNEVLERSYINDLVKFVNAK